MRVPESLAKSFGDSFETLITDFARSEGLLPEDGSLTSDRFLARSIIPHVKKLSALFNRREREEQEDRSLAPYWKESSNPKNLRLAYFCYFMPANLFRMASVWSELHRLGYRWKGKDAVRVLELGAGPGSGVCGIAAAERDAPLGLPSRATWALIEQDRATLGLGEAWARRYFDDRGFPDWDVRGFHRKIDLEEGFLPRNAPAVDLWLSSFFLNELQKPEKEVASRLLDSWQRQLADEGLAILVEPALQAESRRLLTLRKELIEQARVRKLDWFQVLLPCLGHQACGALAAPDDWCHEEVTWWRPPYFRKIDAMANLDRKSLPFSYLVIAKSRRSREELLPALTQGSRRHRLVSPAHNEGRDQEFFICGQEGKSRARFRTDDELIRGDILLDAETRGDSNSVRIERLHSRT